MVCNDVCKAGVVLLPLLLWAAAAPPPAACARLADKYAHRYQILVKEPNKFRPVVIEGTTAPLTVWGARRGPAAAAGALLYAALHYGLGYEAVLEHRPFDDCPANKSKFSVAPVAVSCGTDQTALSAPLLARAAGNCARRDKPLPASDAQRCHFMTLNQFNESFKELFTYCDVTTVSCSPRGAPGAPPAVVLIAAEEQRPDTLDQFLCNISTISLAIVYFNNTSCFHDTLQRLYEDARNLSFLFLSQDLSMYRPEVVTVKLYNDSKKETSKVFNYILESNRAFHVGFDFIMYKYALQIADTVDRFNPQIKDLKEVLNVNLQNSSFDIEAAACNWALHNNYTFESWISSDQEYILYVYLCSNDPLNGEYKKTLSYVKNMSEQEFKFKIVYLIIDCNIESYMYNKLLKILQNNRESSRIMGVIAWSSSAGSPAIAKLANDNQVPLALVGPVAADVEVRSGTITAAINGRLEDLANVYRRFLKECNWSRLVILSDESSYASSFKKYLLKAGGIVQIEKTLTPETITHTLKSLEKYDARIFIVNTDWTFATKILLCATQLDLTPKKGYVWIVREWSPVEEIVLTVDHFSVSWAWSGAGEYAGGLAELREGLHTLWPQRPWPLLAVPLVDAMLLLYHIFAKFNQLYSANTHLMRIGGYAINFSEIYEKINVKGVARDLSVKNSFVENKLVYIEQWNSTKRTVLATWHLQGQAFDEPNQTVCTLRVLDRPSCLLRGGDDSKFEQKCYDPLLYTSVAIFILLPGVFLMARRARLRRLKRRDLKMLANLFETKESNSIVHQDSLYIHKEIGTGHFGRVYLATLRRRRRRSQEKSILVAAKALRNECDKRAYLQEARILEFLNHKNIVKFVGICVANGWRYILMEYALYGDLHHYLKSRRHLAENRHLGDESEAIHISTEALTRLAGEAAAALEYLAQQGLVHRDVRAANCLVDEQRTLKLADFGMARKLCHDQQEYTSIRQALFPVLWMAPESLIYGTFSTSSDVWALGMLFFELATLGRRPYGDWSPQRVLEFVRSGGRPSLPPDMWSQTRSLLTACWQQEPAARPSAAELVRFLAREPRAVRAALLPAPPPPMHSVHQNSIAHF